MPAFAATYTVPPYSAWGVEVNINGKQSGTAGQNLQTDKLCPCLINVNNGCTNNYGNGEIREHKNVGIYSGHGGLATVSYTFNLDGYLKQTGSGSASVVAKISLLDSTGALVTSTTIFSYTLSSGGSIYFDGRTSYTGTINYNLNGYTTYTVSWTVDLTAVTSGNADFYSPFWLTNDMTIVTPSGGAPLS
jgi:hypothetical protein